MTTAEEVIQQLMAQNEHIRASVVRRAAALAALERQSAYYKCIIEQDELRERDRRMRLGIVDRE